MSKWIRNRKRTDGCPDKLVGKIVEARDRLGNIYTIKASSFNSYWNTSDGCAEDFMAYRIIEDESAEKQAEKVKTPYEQLCEKYGVGLDAEWEVVNNEHLEKHINVGDICKLHKDSFTPQFIVNGKNTSFISTYRLRPYKDPSKIAPKLWAAYKDVLNDEALSALRDVICNQWSTAGWSNKLTTKDSERITRAFHWENTTQGHAFWSNVHLGEYNKQKSAIELQDAEIGIPAPVNDVVCSTEQPEIKDYAYVGAYGKIGLALHSNKQDMVNHQPHYTQGGIECIEAIKSALTTEEFRGYCKGNSLKYIWREKHKGGNESIEKAMWYLNEMTK